MDLAFYTNFSTSLTAQESELNTLEQEISSGVAVQTPEANPSAYETALIGNDQLSSLSSESTSLGDIQNQLGDVSNVYSSVSTLLDNVQSVVEEALNGTTSSENMQSLATEVTAAEQQMVGLGNTTGTNGTYLFGGTRGTVQPFQTQNGTVVYMGDGGTSQASISSDLSASTIANGEAFMSGMEGDGYSSVTAGTTTTTTGGTIVTTNTTSGTTVTTTTGGTTTTTATPTVNTGTGVLLSEGVSNPTAAAAFQASNEPVTLTFNSDGNGGYTYTATQTSSGGTTTTQTGTVASGGTLDLDNPDGINTGQDFQLTGSPANGDSFTIAPSQPQSVFSLLSNITSTLQNAGSTPAAHAATLQNLNQDLSSLAQYQQTVTTAQAQTGVTLQSLTTTSSNNSTQETALQNGVDNAIATNIPAAMTSLDDNMTAVQAAMKAFSSVQSLSLFSYI